MGCHIAIAVKSTCFWAATGHHVCTWVSSHAKFQGLSGMIALVIRISGWFRSTKSPLISRSHVWGCHPSVALFNNPPVVRLDLRRAPPTTRNQMKPFSGGISESMNLCSLGDVASQLVPKLWPQENVPNLWVYVPTTKRGPKKWMMTGKKTNLLFEVQEKSSWCQGWIPFTAPNKSYVMSKLTQQNVQQPEFKHVLG